MRTSTFVLCMAAIACAAAIFVGCETLLTPDPSTGISPAADAGLTLVTEIAENPGITGVVNGILGAAAVIGAAFLGRKKIAAGAKLAGQLVGVVKKKVD